MDRKQPTPAGKSTSKALLSVTGDGSSRSVVESLFRQRSQAPTGDKPKTFKIGRSPLLDQLQSFLPAIEKSNQQILERSKDEMEALDIENTDNDKKVVEMNVVVGEMDSESEDESSDHTDVDEDSEDNTPVLGPVTANSLKIPSEARGGRKGKKGLIKVLSDTSEESECDRSDGELTVASSSSVER